MKFSDYETKLQPYIQTILDTYTSYRNTIAELEKEKSSSGLNSQIAKIQLEEYHDSGTERQENVQELTVQKNTIALEQADDSIYRYGVFDEKEEINKGTEKRNMA